MKIKGFDKNLQCRGFQFEVGHEYKIAHDGRNIKLCSDTVFHYCDSLQKVNGYYPVSDEKNRFCEIQVLGEEVIDGDKCGSDHIKILREITGDELDLLKCHTNGNSGLFNTGNSNIGDYNTGNWNFGDYNTGNWNTGDYNTGNWNTGGWNTGNSNTGYYNTGNHNTGDWNTGDCNTGDWNTGDWNTGCFNTVERRIYLFDKPSKWNITDWRYSRAKQLLDQIPHDLVEWIYEEDMTEAEKEENSTYKTTGGYLKIVDESESAQIWWDGLSQQDKNTIINIPNFDGEKFEKCVGIKIE